MGVDGDGQRRRLVRMLLNEPNTSAFLTKWELLCKVFSPLAKTRQLGLPQARLSCSDLVFFHLHIFCPISMTLKAPVFRRITQSPFRFIFVGRLISTEAG
jgi:hypothetical protein